MNYSETLLEKSFNELSYSDIENYFVDEKVETDYIEFKSLNKKDFDLEKELLTLGENICAFLNSDGGIIIWGAPRGEKVSGKRRKYSKVH